MINILEMLHDVVKPANEKTLIHKLVESGKEKEFDFIADAIECDCDGRLFCVNIDDYHLVKDYLEHEGGYLAIDPTDVESVELADVVKDKDYLEDVFMRHINAAYELT